MYWWDTESGENVEGYLLLLSSVLKLERTCSSRNKDIRNTRTMSSSEKKPIKPTATHMHKNKICCALYN